MPSPDRAVDVLVTGAEGHSRSALAAVRALAAGGYRAVVASSDELSVAAASRWCARRVRAPAPTDGEHRGWLSMQVRSGGYLTVLPATDAALIALEPSLAALVEKDSLYTFAERAGFPLLPWRRFDSRDALLAGAASLAFPVVVKPVAQTRGSPVRRALVPADVPALALPEERPLVVQSWHEAELSAVAGVAWDGHLVAVVHQRTIRTWPAELGVSSAAETVHPDPARETKILELVGAYRGIFQAQFVGPYLVDLNLRVFGSLPLAVAAGVNLPAILCDATRANAPDSESTNDAPIRARSGVRYRWLEGDVRHVIGGLRSGTIGRRTLSALRPRLGTVHSVESLRDPAPALVRLRQIVGERRGRRVRARQR